MQTNDRPITDLMKAVHEGVNATLILDHSDTEKVYH